MLTYKLLIINRACYGTEAFIAENRLDVLEIREVNIGGVFIYTSLTCLLHPNEALNYAPLGKLKLYIKLQLPMSGMMPGMV